MQNTSSSYLSKIKEPSRLFDCKITIGNNVYTNTDIVNMTIEDVQPGDGFNIGTAVSKSLELTLSTDNTIYSNSVVKVEIGLFIGDNIEYILMGYFNIDDIEKTDYSIKLTCFDNMMKFEKPYFSNLGKTSSLKNVVNELSQITGVEFTGSLPSYNLNKLEGFTCREILGYIASLCAGNAYITRDGKFTIKTLNSIDYFITDRNYINFKTEDIYNIGSVTCKSNEAELTKGTLSNSSMEVVFENPWVNDSILTDIYNKLKGFEYVGYSMKWQGDLALDVGDVISITDKKGITRQVPILSQKLNYNGGLTSEIGAKGESKNKNEFNSSGNLSNKVNRVVTDLLLVNEALINKADIGDLKAVNAQIENLIADNVTITGELNAVKANIETLKVNVATIDNLTVTHTAQINELKANSATIIHLEATNAVIKNLEANVGKIQTLVNGNLSSENIQAGGITSDKLTIANGFITNAMIANLDVAKVNAGDISTNKFRIKSDDGRIEIVGATQQFKDKNNKVRIQMGQDAKGNFNFIIRGEDGTSTLIDHTGVKEKAIADDLIKENMIAQDSIGEKQIDYSSFITGFNKDTNTNTIKSTKIMLNDQKQTLDVAFNQLKTQADSTKSLTESHSTTIGVMQGQISTAINNTQIVKDGKTILLKDDYNRTVATVDSINSTLGSHSTKINEATGKITGVETRVNTVERDLSSITSRVSATESTTTTLTNKVNTAQNAADSANSKIDNLNIGSKNLTPNTNFHDGLKNWGVWNSASDLTISTEGRTPGCKSARANLANVNGTGFKTPAANIEGGKVYTASFYIKPSIDCTMGDLLKFIDENGTESNPIGMASVFCPSGKWTKIVTTFTAPPSSVKVFSTPRTSKLHSAMSAYITEYMLEEGSKDTTYSPSFEDTQSQIDIHTTEISTTNNKVSSLETSISGIISRVSSVEQTQTTVNGKITSLETRMKTAESKITDSSIISTVSSQFYKKGETDGMYAAKSQITQLENQISSKVDVNGVKSFIEQNPNSVKIGFNKISSEWAFDTDKFTNKIDGKIGLTLGHGRLCVNRFEDGKPVGYYGQTFSEIPNSTQKYWGNVISGTYRSYYTDIGYNPNVKEDGDSTASGFDPYMKMVFYPYGTGYPAQGIYVFKDMILQQKLEVLNALKLHWHVDLGADNTIRVGDESKSLWCMYSNRWRSTNREMTIIPGVNTYGGVMVDGNGYFKPINAGGAYSLGTTQNPFYKLYAVNATSVTSDKRMKSDIVYLDQNAKPVLLDNRMSISTELTTEDFRSFIKDTLRLASYRYNTALEKGETETNIGFIAQDILYDKVGSNIVQLADKNDLDSQLSYNQGNYISIIAGALQQEILKRDQEIQELRSEIKNLKSQRKLEVT